MRRGILTRARAARGRAMHSYRNPRGQPDMKNPAAKVERGDAAQPASDLLPLVYRELRDLARWRLQRAPPGHTLQPTALVHEAYLRVCRGEDRAFSDKG